MTGFHVSTLGDTSRCPVTLSTPFDPGERDGSIYSQRHISSPGSVVWEFNERADGVGGGKVGRGRPMSAVCQKCGARLSPNFAAGVWEAFVIFEDPY